MSKLNNNLENIQKSGDDLHNLFNQIYNSNKKDDNLRNIDNIIMNLIDIVDNDYIIKLLGFKKRLLEDKFTKIQDDYIDLYNDLIREIRDILVGYSKQLNDCMVKFESDCPCVNGLDSFQSLNDEVHDTSVKVQNVIKYYDTHVTQINKY